MSKSLLVNHEFGKIKSGDGVNRGAVELEKGSGTMTNASAIKLVSADGTEAYLFIENDGTVLLNPTLPIVNAPSNSTIQGSEAQN